MSVHPVKSLIQKGTQDSSDASKLSGSGCSLGCGRCAGGRAWGRACMRACGSGLGSREQSRHEPRNMLSEMERVLDE